MCFMYRMVSHTILFLHFCSLFFSFSVLVYFMLFNAPTTFLKLIIRPPQFVTWEAATTSPVNKKGERADKTCDLLSE